jgi:DNA-binding response OmpR family regulator
MKRIRGKILWADDEIDHLRPHILFLEEKGYSVTPVTNAEDAIGLMKNDRFDLVLLDEMMPGMDGLKALSEIKTSDPSVPVVMITKSEEENLMNEAIGAQIEDYLTKPVNPSQIFSSIKRILEKNSISREKITRDYTTEFGSIRSQLDRPLDAEGWIDIHHRLCEREIELDRHPDLGLTQVLLDQRHECNRAFGRFVESSYESWVNAKDRPVMSMDLIRRNVVPLLTQGERVLFVVIDNLRLDQYLNIEPLLYDFFSVEQDHFFSILPTATPFSRNAIFAGLLPAEIQSQHPDLWKSREDDETSLNRHEHALLLSQLERLGLSVKPEPKYVKIMDPDEAKSVARQTDSYFASPLSVMVFNFVDILAHRRSDIPILKEIVPDASAYRSLTRTWFEHSALFHILKTAAESGVTVVLTSDHGSIQVNHGSTVYGDRETSTHIRYKYGKSIRGEAKEVMEIKNPRRCGLPSPGLNTNYLIAKEDHYFVYPTNYHKYLALYRGSFQHGGISLEEMVLPVATLKKRS